MGDVRVATGAISGADATFFDLLDAAAAQLLVVRQPRDLIEQLFELSREALRLDVYFNYLLGEDGALHLAASHGLAPELAKEGATVALGSAVCGMVALERRACDVADIQASKDPHHAFIRKAGLTSYACHPLLVGERLVGTLGFGRRCGGAFTTDEIRFLRTLTRYVAVAHERLRTEGALAESQQRLKAVLDNATVGIFFVDDELRCLFMNAAAERLTGYSFAELEGRNLHDVLLHSHPDGRPYPLEDCPIVHAIPKNQSVTAEEQIIRKGGEFRPIAYTASPMRDEDSRTIGTIIEATDISDRKRTEDARLLLMREVDHRARNALTVVQSIVQLARAETMQELRQIILGRVSALGRAQGLLASERWEGASLTTVIEGEIGAVAGPEAFEIAGTERRLQPEDVQPIGMIVHELATNAAKYGALSARGGTIRVTLEPGGFIWEERGGPKPEPARQPGFGMRMMRQLAQQIGGELGFEWSDTGLRVRLRKGAPQAGRLHQPATLASKG